MLRKLEHNGWFCQDDQGNKSRITKKLKVNLSKKLYLQVIPWSEKESEEDGLKWVTRKRDASRNNTNSANNPTYPYNADCLRSLSNKCWASLWRIG